MTLNYYYQLQGQYNKMVKLIMFIFPEFDTYRYLDVLKPL